MISFHLLAILVAVVLLQGVRGIHAESNGCPQNYKAEVIFVVDSSTSVGVENFEKLKAFVINVTRAFNVLGKDGVRVALVQYSSWGRTKVVFNFGDHNNRKSLETAIEGLKYTKGGTKTAYALYLAKKQAEAKGRKGVKVTIVLLTDGKASDNPRGVARQLHQKNYTIFAVGIGKPGVIDVNEFRMLASKPKEMHMFLVNDFKKLPYFLKSVVTGVVCRCVLPFVWDAKENKCKNRCVLPSVWDVKENKCKNTCKEDQKWDAKTKACVARCVLPFVWDVKENKCKNTCKEDQKWDAKAKRCVATCKEDQRWDANTKTCIASCPHNYKAEIIFVVDSSTSGVENFEKFKAFVINVTRAFKVLGKDGVRVALVQYSSWLRTKVVFNFGDHNNRKSLETAIEGLKYTPGDTEIGYALYLVRKQAEAKARKGVKVNVVLLTNRKATDYVGNVARRLHQKNYTVFAIGVGKPGVIDDNELRMVASKPKEMHMFRPNDFKELPYLRKSVVTGVCPVTAAVKTKKKT